MSLLSECGSFQEEIHKLFQYIDNITRSTLAPESASRTHSKMGAKGYLEIAQITAFQKILASSKCPPNHPAELMTLTKADESALVVQFMCNLQSEQVRIDWPCFYSVLSQWVVNFTQIPD